MLKVKYYAKTRLTYYYTQSGDTIVYQTAYGTQHTFFL